MRLRFDLFDIFGYFIIADTVCFNQSGFTPIFRCIMFLTVAPHNGGHVLVYVRVASPLAQAASTQSQ